MMKIRTILIVILLSAFILAGCQRGENPGAALPQVTPQSGMGVIRGQLDPVPANWSGKTVFAFAASYLGDPEGEGIFALDETLHPKAELDERGQFQIENIPPGYYVMVFGPNSEEAAPYREGASAVKVKVDPDQVVELGTITVAP